MPALVDLRLEPADLLMPHLDVEAVFVQLQNALLERRSHRPVSPLPILLLHDLRRAHFFDCGLVERRLHPKLELRRRRKNYVDDLPPVDVEPRNGRMRMKQLEQFFFDVSESISQHRAAVDALAVVDQKAGDAERADGAIGLLVVVLEIIVDEPIDARIDGHVDLGVVDRRDAGQHHARAVGLHGGARIKIFHVLQKHSDGNFLVGIVARHVDPDQRHEFNLGMFAEHFFDVVGRRVRLDGVEQVSHCDHLSNNDCAMSTDDVYWRRKFFLG